MFGDPEFTDVLQALLLAIRKRNNGALALNMPKILEPPLGRAASVSRAGMNKIHPSINARIYMHLSSRSRPRKDTKTFSRFESRFVPRGNRVGTDSTVW